MFKRAVESDFRLHRHLVKGTVGALARYPSCQNRHPLRSSVSWEASEHAAERPSESGD